VCDHVRARRLGGIDLPTTRPARTRRLWHNGGPHQRAGNFNTTRVARIGPGQDSLPKQRDLLESLTSLKRLQIDRALSAGSPETLPGYALARAMREPAFWTHRRSEGTLADYLRRIAKSPRCRSAEVGLLFFASVGETRCSGGRIARLKSGGD